MAGLENVRLCVRSTLSVVAQGDKTGAIVVGASCICFI